MRGKQLTNRIKKFKNRIIRIEINDKLFNVNRNKKSKNQNFFKKPKTQKELGRIKYDLQGIIFQMF